MKQLIIILIILMVAFLFGCTRYYCQPSKGSKDYAIKHIEHTGPGYIITLVRFEKGVRVKQEIFTECLPDGWKKGVHVCI